MFGEVCVSIKFVNDFNINVCFEKLFIVRMIYVFVVLIIFGWLVVCVVVIVFVLLLEVVG